METTQNIEPRAAGEAAHSLFRSIEKTRAFLTEVEAFFAERAELQNWHHGVSLFYGNLIQFHPHREGDLEDLPQPQRKESARRLASSLGGSWRRDGLAWQGDVTLPSGTLIRIVLHKVEGDEPRGALIDLTSA